MLFIFTTPVIIRHLWQLNTVVFLHWCLIDAVLFRFFRFVLINAIHACRFLIMTRNTKMNEIRTDKKLFKIANVYSALYVLNLLRWRVRTRKSYWRERLSTVNLLVLTRLDQLFVILRELFTFLQNKLPQLGGQLYWAFPFVSIPWLGHGALK